MGLDRQDPGDALLGPWPVAALVVQHLSCGRVVGAIDPEAVTAPGHRLKPAWPMGIRQACTDGARVARPPHSLDVFEHGLGNRCIAALMVALEAQAPCAV